MRLLILMLLLVSAISAQALPLRKTSDEIVFGAREFAVVFDAKTGAMKKLISDGRPVLEGNRSRIPFNLKLENRRMLGEGDPDLFRLTGVSQADDNTLELTIKAGEFTAKGIYRLFPDVGRLESSYELSGPADRTLRVYEFRENLPDAVFSGESYYQCPVLFPRTDKRCSGDLSAGRTVVNWRDPCATIVQLDPKRTLLTLQNRTRPYADIGRTEIIERKNGISLTQIVDASGFLRPGEPWRIGDFHCWVQNNGGDTALLRIHEWMKQSGMTVPTDRNPAVGKTILYSFHPGMPGHPFQDWGGFASSTGQLARIRRLNCNTVWILPVESECPYIPDDFYRIADGIGTPEEYKTLVRTAQQLGMKVWQDVVPHGGRGTNSRAVAHPDWLIRDEAGNVPRVRSFDYNNPGWQNYLREVVRFYTDTYGLDGWRIDTGGFSVSPNWSAKIPYTRGSWAMGQGGLGMMRALRNGAREANPAAVTLAESDGSIYGVAADAVYDFPLCRQVFKSIIDLPPDRFVGELTAWLHEQKHAELEDLIRLRYVDSHDEPRSELLYGPEALRAGVALTAWIHGIPMLYKEMEDGHSAIFARIMKLREELPELSVGSAVYPGCKVTPGVFACLRSDGERLSIPLINFNPVAVKTELSVPLENLPAKLRDSISATELWNGNTIPLVRRNDALFAEVELPAYGFTILRLGSPVVVPAVNCVFPAGGDTLPVEMFRLNADGSRSRIERSGSSPNGTVLEFPLSGDSALMFRIPLGGEPASWRVRSGCGTVEDRFRTRHPFFNAKMNNMYSLPSGHNVLYSSVAQPFGFTEKNASVTLYTDKRSIRFSFPPMNRPGGVFLLDRIGEDHNPWLVVVKQVPDSPLAAAGDRISLRLSPGNAETTGPAETGDARLNRIAGGWLFDNGKISLRIASNGSLTGWWTREADGSLLQRINNLRIDLESGYAGGDHRFNSAQEMEAFSLLEKLPDGTLLLRFFGRPRGRHFYHILPPNMLNYLIAYTLNDSGFFGLTCGVRPVTEVSGDRMRLALTAVIPGQSRLELLRDGKPLTEDGKLRSLPDALKLTGRAGGVFFDRIATTGRPPERIMLEKDILSWNWYLEQLPEREFGVWQTFSAVVGTGTVSDAPAPWRDIPGRSASVVAGELLDPSFEFDYWGAFPDIVQMYATALPWQMPFGGSVVTGDSADGAKAAKISFGVTKEEQRIRQRLTGKRMRAGETWQLSAMVKAEALEYEMSRSTADLRLHSSGRSVAVSFPAGSYGYRKFAVDFPVPADPGKLEIQIGGKAKSGAILIDNLQLRKISDAPPEQRKK